MSDLELMSEDAAIDQDRVATAVANLPPLLPAGWPLSGLKPHPYASVFRMLTGPERDRFEDDVLENGLRERIVVFEDAILDGRNRYLAIIEAGVFDPEEDDWRDLPDLFGAFDGTEAEAADYVLSRNEARRHDTPTQRAIAAARLARVRDMGPAEVAALFGVSERQVSSANHVLDHGVPELGQAMDDGRLPAYLAEKVADLEEDDQREVAGLPKGEASAKAREKLAEPAPLAESGPVVKPLDPARFVLFAEAVLMTSAMGHSLTPATVDGLAREHALLADNDGTFNLGRDAVLAVELARKKLQLADGKYSGLTAVIMGSAGLPEDHDSLVQAYRNAIVLYDRAVRTGDTVGEAKFSVAMDAVLFKANGNSQVGLSVNEAPSSIVAAARAPDGVVPMWGQQGCFITEGEWRGDEVRAIVVLGRYNSIYAIDPGQPFPSDTGYLTVNWQFRGRDVQAYGAELISAAIRGVANAGKAMPVPSTIYQISEGGSTGPVPVSLEGGELDRTAYQKALAALTEPKGKLHQSTAADAVRAGHAAKVPYSQMAEDLGHPIGTVLGWAKRLGLTGKGEGRSAPRPRHAATEVAQ